MHRQDDELTGNNYLANLNQTNYVLCYKIICPTISLTISVADLDCAKHAFPVERARSAVIATSPAGTAPNAISPVRIARRQYPPSRLFLLLSPFLFLARIQRVRITIGGSRSYYTPSIRPRRPRRFLPYDSRPIFIRTSAMEIRRHLPVAMMIRVSVASMVEANLQTTRTPYHPRRRIM